MRAALTALHDREPGAARMLEEIRPAIIPDTTPTTGADGNNVDIEREMTELSEATLRYEAMARLIRRRFQMLGTAIGDGRQR